MANRYKKYLQEKASAGENTGGDMTVREAGQKGGEKGGERVRELIEEGKQKEREEGKSR